MTIEQVKINMTDFISKNQKDVSVILQTFNTLSNVDSPLVLDNYQRAYVWGADKVTRLLDDLESFIQEKKDNDYYMGAILLHEKADSKQRGLCVIDGQQRLTSLSILYWLLNGNLPPYISFVYRSTLSMVNIQKAKLVMDNWFIYKKSTLKDQFVKAFERLCFSVITVSREDLAFTFFDTQNNRGIPLGSTDLLKAFHLRAINSDDATVYESLQSHCASRWEKVQLQGKVKESKTMHDFAPELFNYYLWRMRNWTGTRVTDLVTKDEILSHFGERTKYTKLGEVQLYPAGMNQWGKSINLTQNNDFDLSPSNHPIGAQAAYLPFSLRQPLSRGVGFFLYAEKYAEMLNLLFYSPSMDREIQAVQKFYKDVLMSLSHYLLSLIRLCLLAYFDSLGSKGLLRFALWLDHRIGQIRLSQSDIRRQTPTKFLKESQRNLLDVIAYAYESDDVIEFLKEVDVSKTYQLNNGWSNEIQSNRLVQERYASAVSKYYGITNLNEKSPTLIEKFVESQLLNSKNQINFTSNGVSHV